MVLRWQSGKVNKPPKREKFVDIEFVQRQKLAVQRVKICKLLISSGIKFETIIKGLHISVIPENVLIIFFETGSLSFEMLKQHIPVSKISANIKRFCEVDDEGNPINPTKQVRPATGIYLQKITAQKKRSAEIDKELDDLKNEQFQLAIYTDNVDKISKSSKSPTESKESVKRSRNDDDYEELEEEDHDAKKQKKELSLENLIEEKHLEMINDFERNHSDVTCPEEEEQIRNKQYHWNVCAHRWWREQLLRKCPKSVVDQYTDEVKNTLCKNYWQDNHMISYMPIEMIYWMSIKYKKQYPEQYDKAVKERENKRLTLNK